MRAGPVVVGFRSRSGAGVQQVKDQSDHQVFMLGIALGDEQRERDHSIVG